MTYTVSSGALNFTPTNQPTKVETVYGQKDRWTMWNEQSVRRDAIRIRWQWRNFVPCLCQLIFAAILWVKTLKNACHCDNTWVHFVGKSFIIRTFCKTNWFDFIWKHDKSSPFNSTHYIASYPQDGDRIVTIDSVTLLHPVYVAENQSLTGNSVAW